MGEGPTPNNLAHTLFGGTRGRILGLLYGHPDQSFYFQQIRRETQAPGVGAVQRELGTLVDLGLITSTRLGHQIHYKANQLHPVFPELRALVAKTVGVFAVLRSRLEPLAPQIRVAFVYGSLARQQERAVSDVDLMIVGDATLEDTVEVLNNAEREIGRPVDPIVYGVSEFRNKLKQHNHFLSAVLKQNKIFLIGGEDELAAIRG